MPGIRVPGRRRPGWPRPWTRTSRHRSPAGLLRRARSRHTSLRLIDPRRGASPTAATRGSSAPCSPPPSPHCAPTPSPGSTTSANATKTKRLGPGRPRPGPPPHPDPARHDPQRRTLRPPTSHETTRSRLTHHIGGPHPAPRQRCCHPPQPSRRALESESTTGVCFLSGDEGTRRLRSPCGNTLHAPSGTGTSPPPSASRALSITFRVHDDEGGQ